MKILKTLLWLVLFLVGGFLLLGAVSRKDFKTSQSTVINAPQSLVFNTVNDLSTWESWSPWIEMDATSVTTMGEKFIGKDGFYSWTGEEIGSGKMTITDSQAPNKIDTHVSFDGQGDANARFDFEPEGKGTKASWNFHSHVGFPMNAMMVLMGMEKMIDKNYARGLELLKAKVEKIASEKPALSVKEVDYPGQTFVMIRDHIGMDKISDFYQKNLPTVFGIAQKGKLKMTGMPYGLFFSWDIDNKKTDIGAAIPVAAAGRSVKGASVFKTKKGKALQVDYYGEYSGTVDAHHAIEAHMKANGQEFLWPCMETYITDPTTEPDTSKWLTQVIYPLK